MKITTLFSQPQPIRDASTRVGGTSSLNETRACSLRHLDSSLSRHRSLNWILALLSIGTLMGCAYLLHNSPDYPSWMVLPVAGLAGMVAFSLQRMHRMTHQVLTLEAQMLELRSRVGRGPRLADGHHERMPGFSSPLSGSTDGREVRQCQVTPTPLPRHAKSARKTPADLAITRLYQG